MDFSHQFLILGAFISIFPEFCFYYFILFYFLVLHPRSTQAFTHKSVVVHLLFFTLPSFKADFNLIGQVHDLFFVDLDLLVFLGDLVDLLGEIVAQTSVVFIDFGILFSDEIWLFFSFFYFVFKAGNSFNKSFLLLLLKVKIFGFFRLLKIQFISQVLNLFLKDSYLPLKFLYDVSRRSLFLNFSQAFIEVFAASLIIVLQNLQFFLQLSYLFIFFRDDILTQYVDLH